MVIYFLFRYLSPSLSPSAEQDVQELELDVGLDCMSASLLSRAISFLPSLATN